MGGGLLAKRQALEGAETHSIGYSGKGRAKLYANSYNRAVLDFQNQRLLNPVQGVGRRGEGKHLKVL